MYQYDYNEYMNNLLGYHSRMNIEPMYSNPIETYEDENMFTYHQTNSELEKCYPDIYRIIYPMVCKACLYINEEITEELVEKITNEIYENVEADECSEETKEAQVKVNYTNIHNNRNMRYMPKKNENNNKIEEKRQKNFLLNDLIKILVLRELLGPGRRPPKPFPPHRPGRPTILRPPII